MKSILIIVMITFVVMPVFGSISFLPSNVFKRDYQIDTMLNGAGFIVNDTSPIIIKYIKGYEGIFGMPLGELYFILPGSNDSLIFLFHNRRDFYPSESDSLNIGKFELGTPLVLMYMLIDTSKYYSDHYRYKYYSGQNRAGIDHYVSEDLHIIDGSNYGQKRIASSRTNDSTVITGVDGEMNFGFKSIIIQIQGVALEVREKNLVPRPKIQITENDTSCLFSLSVPDDGLKSYYLPFTRVFDSTIIESPLDSGAALEIYYSLDDNKPAHLYTGPVKLTKSSNIKAYAKLSGPGTKNWYPSETVEYIYKKDTTTIINHNRSFSLKISQDNMYDLRGCRVSFNKVIRDGLYLKNTGIKKSKYLILK